MNIMLETKTGRNFKLKKKKNLTYYNDKNCVIELVPYIYDVKYIVGYLDLPVNVNI